MDPSLQDYTLDTPLMILDTNFGDVDGGDMFRTDPFGGHDDSNGHDADVSGGSGGGLHVMSTDDRGGSGAGRGGLHHLERSDSGIFGSLEEELRRSGDDVHESSSAFRDSLQLGSPDHSSAMYHPMQQQQQQFRSGLGGTSSTPLASPSSTLSSSPLSSPHHNQMSHQHHHQHHQQQQQQFAAMRHTQMGMQQQQQQQQRRHPTSPVSVGAGMYDSGALSPSSLHSLSSLSVASSSPGAHAHAQYQQRQQHQMQQQQQQQQFHQHQHRQDVDPDVVSSLGFGGPSSSPSPSPSASDKSLQEQVREALRSVIVRVQHMVEQDNQERQQQIQSGSAAITSPMSGAGMVSGLGSAGSVNVASRKLSRKATKATTAKKKSSKLVPASSPTRRRSLAELSSRDQLRSPTGVQQQQQHQQHVSMLRVGTNHGHFGGSELTSPYGTAASTQHNQQHDALSYGSSSAREMRFHPFGHVDERSNSARGIYSGPRMQRRASAPDVDLGSLSPASGLANRMDMLAFDDHLPFASLGSSGDGGGLDSFQH